VGPRAGLDDVEKKKFLTLPGLELRLLGRPAHSQSLYRLRYIRGHFYNLSTYGILRAISYSNSVMVVKPTANEARKRAAI
jgi:hypothetical protein